MRQRWLMVLVTAAAVCRGIVLGQVGPLYPDDSVAAREGLARAAQLAQAGNVSEAARVLQAILDTERDRVIESLNDPDLFVSVRQRVHERLLADPALLAHYRSVEEAKAAAILTSGDTSAVEGARLLTRAGFEACLRVAQEHIELADFEGARLTLLQLESHPDRRAHPGAADAAAIARLLSGYVARAEVTDLAARWSTEANVAAPASNLITPPARPQMRSPLTSAPAARPEAAVPRPLQSVYVSVGAEQEAAGDARRTGRDGRRVSWAQARDNSDEPWVLPTVVGDVVYANDGRSIGAWDRYTLAPIWRTTPSDPARNPPESSQGRVLRERQQASNLRNALATVEDTSSVTWAGSLVLATTGIAGREGRDGDPRLHAVDAATGAVMWSILPPYGDEAVAQASIRGPVVVDGPTAVIGVRTIATSRRVASISLAGVDIWTGRVKWFRPLGSAGWLPFQRTAHASEIATLSAGVVFRADELGAVAAVQASNGRPVWVRRFRGEVNTARMENLPPWSGAAVVADGNSIIVLSPVRDAILRLDAGTGVVLASRPAADLGDPLYIVPSGDDLACIALDRVTFVDRAQFHVEQPRATARVVQPRMRGRAVDSAGLLVVPTDEGVLLVDRAAPEEARRVRLEKSGNIIAEDAHLLAADRSLLHTFLEWESAERLLMERIAADPADARSALTLAELAYRSGRHDRVCDAFDLAIESVQRGSPLRRSVVDAIRSMMEPALAAMLDPAAPQRDSLIRDPATLDALAARLARLSDSPEERVAYLMAIGRLREVQSAAAADPLPSLGAAAEAYQRVLTDDTLAHASWTGPGLTARADLEATRRLLSVVHRAGRLSYATFDAEAERELAALRGEPGADPAEAAERLARRYPASRTAPAAWKLAAEAHDRADRAAAAMNALGSGLDSAEWLLASGVDDARADVGELAGRLFTSLERTDRLAAAAQLAERLSTERPEITLTVNGVPIDVGAVGADLRRRLAGLDRRARIGQSVAGAPQVLQGWSIIRPLSRSARARSTEAALLINTARQELSLFGSSGDNDLRPLWSRPFEGAGAPSVVLHDAVATLLFWPTEDGGSLERIDTVGGRTRWKSPPFATLFPGAVPLAARQQEVPTPLDGLVRRGDFVVALDSQTAALCDRSGRIATFDAATGRTLWSGRAPMTTVYDATILEDSGATAGGALLLVAGVVEGGGPGVDIGGTTPTVVAFDARTGKVLHQLSNLGSEVRWMRAGPNGIAVMGLESRMVGIHVPTGRAVWEAPDEPAPATLGAWQAGSRLLVLTGARDLLMVDPSAGPVKLQTLESRGRLEDPTRMEVAALATPAGPRVAVTTRRGVLLYGVDGSLQGMDALDGAAQVTPADATESCLVTVESDVRRLDDGRDVVSLHFFDIASAQVTQTQFIGMAEPPRDLIAIDGHILISAGDITLVLNAPPEQGSPSP